VDEFDVVIAGGGVAGCSCAYNAAKLGLRTLLIEKNSFLGGAVTGGLVIPAMKTGEKKLNHDFFDALVVAAKNFDAQITYLDGNEGWFNPELLKIVLENLLQSVGCKILFESTIFNVEKKSSDKFFGEVCYKSSLNTLSLPFISKYMVDATGEGNLAELLNCEFWQDSRRRQPNSLRFMMSGVDIGAFCGYLDEIDKDRGVTNFAQIEGEWHFTTAYTWDSNKKWALEPLFKKAVEAGELLLEDADYFQLFSVAKMPHAVSFNCPRLKEPDGEVFGRSKSIINGRATIFRLANFCKKYLKGFENAFISHIGDIGVREFRRVKCKYDFTINDINEPKTFENPILYTDYPVDIHSNKRDGSTLREVRTYSPPLESLMVRDVEGLFVVGKCLGADFQAQASLRVQPSCMSMGEGVAKHIATQINK